MPKNTTAIEHLEYMVHHDGRCHLLSCSRCPLEGMCNRISSHSQDEYYQKKEALICEILEKLHREA